MKLSGPQLIALYDLKGTGRFVGKGAQMKTRTMYSSDYCLRTLLALRKKGLIEHFIACDWYLTDEGRAFVSGGKAVMKSGFGKLTRAQWLDRVIRGKDWHEELRLARLAKLRKIIREQERENSCTKKVPKM